MVEQLVVIHDDGYARTYEVTAGAFVEADGASASDELGDLAASNVRTLWQRLENPRRSCASTIERLMAERPFLGGCPSGRGLVARHGPLGCVQHNHVRDVQMWDTTEAAWFLGRVLGVSQQAAGNEWIVAFEDETVYEFDPRTTVWKLVRLVFALALHPKPRLVQVATVCSCTRCSLGCRHVVIGATSTHNAPAHAQLLRLGATNNVRVLYMCDLGRACVRREALQCQLLHAVLAGVETTPRRRRQQRVARIRK